MSNTDQSAKITIYVAPGYNSCNVYSMPYAMRPGQSPRDLNDRYKDQWTRIGQLDHNLKIRFLDPKFTKLADDIQGMGPLSHFTIKASDLDDDDPSPDGGTHAPVGAALSEDIHDSESDDSGPAVGMSM